MTVKTTKSTLNIRFHNPNSNDEVAKFLAKVIAGKKADELLSGIHKNEPPK